MLTQDDIQNNTKTLRQTINIDDYYSLANYEESIAEMQIRFLDTFDNCEEKHYEL